MKLKQFIFALVAMLLSFVSPAFAQVAKVGNTEYATIDEAIANWTNNATLTLLADVTLSDVVTLKSTEHHILDLSTYTMTAASGKNAIVIQACGTGSAERTAITINADAENPGGINAGNKCVVYYKYEDGGISTEDRPIIKINGGVFTGSTSSWGTAGIYTIGTAARKCATLNISGGTFNCSINGSGKSKLIISGGVFNYSVGSQGDSTALRLISGGKFKTLGFMTADDNNTKFWFGTSMANSNVGLYVDDEGYLCVGGPVIKEVSAKYPAVASNYSKWSSHLKYSAAATYGLFYEDADAAIKKHGAANVTVWEPVKAPAVEEVAPENATEEEKAVVEDVIEEVTNNAAVKNNTVELPAEVVDFTIELAKVEVAEGTTPEAPETPVTVVTEISYTVTPSNAAGEKVSNPSESITFRLPLPSNWASEKVQVIYNGKALPGNYEVKTENNAKFVEVESQSFSTYTVKAIVPLESYVQLPAGMDASNYETLFGTNTVTDGTNYYATLQAAVEAVAGQANAVLYCKPGADVGSLQHAPVVSTLTIYGNGANVTGGSERDFDLGNTDPSGGRDITADMTLTVKHLNGCGAWGAKVTSHTVNLVFENCANMGKVFITGTTGTLNITMNDCAFEGVIKEAVYSNADGAITLNNVAFSNLNKAINLNHKAAGTQTVTINGCSFTNCGADVAADQIPVRVLSSVDGGKSVLNVSNTTFTGTPEGGADILLDYAVGETTASVTATAANVFVEKENNVATKTTVTESEGGEFTNVVPVAKVNGIEYATLDEAITAAQNGETIILIADVKLTAQVVIPEGKVLTLDLNGNTVNSVFNDNSTTNHIYALSNKGTLTIKDSEGNGSINSRGIYNYGSLTLNAGAINAIDGNGGYAVNNQSGSTFVMNGGVVAATNEDDHQSSSGGYDATALKVPAGCTATLNGGTINNVCDFTYAIDAAGTLNIPETSTIKVNGTHGAIAVSGGVTTIDAGTFQIPADNYSRTDNVLYVSGGSLVVNGGTFIGDSDTAGGGSCLYDAAGKAVVNGGTFKGSSGGDVWGTTGTTIKGGTFENLTEKQHIAAGYELNADGTVAAKPVASINGTKYTSLSEAVAAAQANETITLIADVELAEVVTIPADKTLNIDLNGKAISMQESIITTAYAFNNLGNLKITDGVGGGSINARGIYNGYGNGGDNVATATITVLGGTFNAKGTNGGAAIFNYGTANVNGGKFTSIGGYSLNNQAGAKMNITDGVEVTGGIYNNSNAELIVDGGNISNNRSGCHTIYAWNAKVIVNGGSIHNENSGNATIMSAGTSEVTINGGTISIKDGRVPGNGNTWTSCLTDAANTAKIIVNGGTFNGGFRVQAGSSMTINGGSFNDCFGSGYNIYGTAVVKGGTFTDDAAKNFAKNNIADDYKLGEDGKVVYAPVVAKIGETKYETLDAAFAAATEGQTITMLVDATPALTSQRAITKAAVIDLGGKTLTLTEDDLYFGTTTFKNGTIVVDPSVKPSTAVFWMFANQTLTFDNVKVVATGVTGTYLIGLEGDNSDLNLLNGSEILVENTTALDLDIICVNGTNTCDIKVENSKVNVTNLDGRVFFRGNYTVKDSEVNLAGITKAGFRIEAGQTLSIEGTSKVNIEGEPRDGGIHMTDLSATYTKAETATVNATLNRPAVAKIGDTPYYSFAEAAAAANAGDEIVMLADATVEGTLALPAGIKLTSNGHTITGSIRMLGDLELNGPLTITGGLWVGKSGETLTATLSGDKLTASYFMFQRGTYTIDADIDAVYGYLSYEGTFEVNSTIHTTGTNGEVLYINGNVTLNDGAVLDSDNSVFVCNNNAVLTLKPGSKVDSNVSITTSGAKLYIDATGMTAGASANITGTVTNSGNGTIAVVGNDKLEAKIVDGKVVLNSIVAKIGDAKFTSLQAAIEAVQEGETITVLEDITFTTGANGSTNGISYTRGASFTLDLNGKTITSNLGNNALRFKIGDGNTVRDTEVTVLIKNGKIVSGSNNWCAISAATADNSGNKLILNLTDLTIEANKAGDFAVKSWAGAVVNTNNVDVTSNYAGGFYAVGGEIVLDENSSVAQKGLHTAPYMSYAFGVSSGTGKMTVNGGTYSAVPAAASDGYNQGVSHGSSVGGVMSSGGTLIINGGTFSNDNFGDAAPTAPRSLIMADAGAVVTINGGTFNAMAKIVDPTNNTGVASKNAVVTIAGGTYSANPTDAPYNIVKLAEDYIAVENNGVWNVAKVAAKIGEQGYASLQAAFNAVQDGETITLVDNVTISAATAGYTDGTYTDGVRYTGDKSFTVDFNGKTVTDDGCVNDYLIYINNKGEKASEITFTNGTIVSANGCWSAVCVNSSTATQNVELNLNGMNITNSNDAVYSGNPVVRVRTLATVNVNDGTIITSNGASYGVTANTDGSTVNINEGATIVQQNSGTTGGNSVFAAVGGKGVINIKGGTITSDRYGVHTMTTGTPVINISGGTITAPVALKSSTNGGNGEIATINVTGGTINGTLESYTDNGKIVVSGGTFSEAVAEEYCAEGFVPAENADGTFGVEKAAAKIGAKYYASLAEAFTAAQDGETITVLHDIEETETAINTKNVTLDLNGKTVTMVYTAKATKNHTMVSNSGNLTIESSVEGGKLSYTYAGEDLGVSYSTNTVTSNPGSVLTVKSGTIENLTYDKSVIAYAIDGLTNGGAGDVTVNIEGGVITSKRQAVRIFANSTANTGALNISGGDITGRVIVQNANANANKAALEITGGTFNANDYKTDVLYVGGSSSATIDINATVSGGTFNGEITETNVAGFITGGAYKTDVNQFCALGYQAQANAEGLYAVEYTGKVAEFTIVDGEYTEFNIEEDVEVGTLTYTRTIYEGWNALYVPFEIPVNELTNDFEVAYINDMHWVDKNDDFTMQTSEMTMEVIKIKNGTLKANHPYIIRQKNGANIAMNLVLNDVILHKTSEKVDVEFSSAYVEYKVSGTYTKAGVDILNNGNDIYIVSGDNFGVMNNAYPLPAFRIFMTVENKEGSPVIIDQSAPIRIRVAGEKDEATGIITPIIEGDVHVNDGTVYDLMGRPVRTPEKGKIYIMNGKKVLF